MSTSRRDFLRLSTTSVAGLWLTGVWGLSAAHAASTASAEAAGISPERHVLNRLTWGVRAQDRANIQELGVEGYIDWQLNPEKIDDPLVDQFVASRNLLTMQADELSKIADNNYDFVLGTALWARVYRAAYSERQLYERMVEFWTDHFNVPIADLIVEKVIDDREVVRRNALGSFRDMLFASAQSPAMLEYLNNADSNKDHPNQNYAREVMELHTLGVDGGYTQQDVIEVARAFTGWTIDNGVFYFDMSNHDTDAKAVLGHQLPAGRGIEDGLQVLDILARHPSNAQFISMKLARRFVSDDPPQSLIDSTAQVYTASSGDIRQVMRHLLTSNEFMASAGRKFRRPLEAIVANMRVLGSGLEIQNPEPIINRLEEMGQLPFYWHPPNGYPDVAGPWISSSGLLMRWNTALELSLAGEGYFDGSFTNLDQVIPSANTVGELLDAAVEHTLGTTLAPSDRDQLISFLSRSSDPSEALTAALRQDKLPGLVGLLMASPYFQWY